MDASKEMAEPKPRDLALVAWALGVMQCNNIHLTTSLFHFIQSLSDYLFSMRSDDSIFQGWKSADIVQLAVGLAHGRLDRKELLEPMFIEVQRSLNSSVGEMNRVFSTTELTTLLWVQARLHLVDHVYQKFLDLATKTLVQRLCLPSPSKAPNYLDPQQQANLAWSLVVLENYSSEAVTLLKTIFASSYLIYSQGENFHVEHAHQLWQAYCILQQECPSAIENVSSDFVECLHQRWMKEKLRLKTSSERHMALSKTLDLMGVAHMNEHDEDIDVAIILKTDSQWTQNAAILGDSSTDGRFHRVAVEFDGPNHFVRPMNGIKLGPKECPRPLGHTVLKYRLLKHQGWFVVRVPYYEYDKIPFWASMVRWQSKFASFPMTLHYKHCFKRKSKDISSDS
jgi:hypothetical protein